MILACARLVKGRLMTWQTERDRWAYQVGGNLDSEWSSLGTIIGDIDVDLSDL